MNEALEQRVEELEKRVAALEGQIHAQPKKFVPEDSDNGICTNQEKVIGQIGC